MSNNVRYLLNREYANGQRAIQLRTVIKGSLFTYQTGYSIYPDLWDKLTQRPTTVKKIIAPYLKSAPTIKTDLKSIKQDLGNLEKKIQTLLLEYKTIGNKIDFKDLREKLNQDFKQIKEPIGKTSKESETLNEYINRYIKEIEKGMRTYTTSSGEMRKYSHGTIKTYKGFQAKLNDYQNVKKVVLDFDDITLDFYDSFVRHYINKGDSINNTGKHIKTLKTLMRASHEEKLHTSIDYLSSKFKTLKVEVANIYLSQKEVDTLYRFDFNSVPIDELDRKLIPKYERTRDIFLCGVWTAQRYSDYSKIGPENIKERDGQLYYVRNQQKESVKVYVPIRPELNEILKRYDYRLPKSYEQKVNANIKEICRLAEINEPIEIQEIKKGLKVRKSKLKYEMVKTHTARRTAITLMYLANIPTIDIMAISGHKTEKNLLKYIKVTKEETAIRLSSNSYFSGPKLKKVV